jgi:hydrogenase nickel incorporation protein HypA/HybF
MHEWALAEGVVLTIEKEAKERKFNEIEKITISLGELQQVDKSILKFAIEEIIASQDQLFKKAEIAFKTQKAVLLCRNCRHKWSLAENEKKFAPDESEAIHFVPEVAHVYMRCPQCKSPDFEILQGRGLWVDSIIGKMRD